MAARGCEAHVVEILNPQIHRRNPAMEKIPQITQIEAVGAGLKPALTILVVSSGMARLAIAVVLLSLWPNAFAKATSCIEPKTPRTRIVQGFVVDPTGVPIPEVKLILRKRDRDGEIVATAMTDSEGRFRFRQFPVGKYHLTAEYEVFKQTTTQVVITQSRSEQDGIILSMEFADSCPNVRSGKLPKRIETSS